MTRNSNSDDCHESETALNKENFDWNNFDRIVKNDDCGIKETNRIVYDNLAEWGWADNDFSVDSVQIQEPIKVPKPEDESGCTIKARK